MIDVCGFMVLRKPDFAGEKFHELNLKIGEKIYRGIDRLPWEDIDEAFYNGNISETLRPVREQIERENRGLVGPKLLRDYKAALSVWHAFREKTEIVAVWSPELAERQSAVSYSGSANYLGSDCIVPGEWSLILRGIFHRPQFFAEFVFHLNENGLLASQTDCDRLLKRYVDMSTEDENDIEPLAEGALTFHTEVFLINED